MFGSLATTPGQVATISGFRPGGRGRPIDTHDGRKADGATSTVVGIGRPATGVGSARPRSSNTRTHRDLTGPAVCRTSGLEMQLQAWRRPIVDRNQLTGTA